MLTSYYSNYQATNRLTNEISYEQYSSKNSNPYLNQPNQLHQHYNIINNNNNNSYNQALLNLPVENNCSIYQPFEHDNSKFEEWKKTRTINYINDLKLGNEFRQTLDEQKSINLVVLDDKLIDINEQSPSIKPRRKIKKSRVLFSQWQINELEKLFKKQKYVTSNEREIISKRLKLNPNQIKIWFQNRRYKIKKRMESENNNFNNSKK
jgi:hypothetical protein